jgi:plasmid stabilization system protein ParE
LSRLQKFPQSGKALPEFPDLPFREVVVTPYRFFSRVKEKTIWIVAVWHGAQLPEEPYGTESG